MPPRPTIVSLIASATEIACALGLRPQLIGISHECDYPPDVKGLPVLSRPKVDPEQASDVIDREVRAIVREGLSVYRVKVEELERLKPDLILTQDHCEVCAVSLKDVEDALCRVTLTDTKVCSLHPGNLEDIRRDFRKVAAAAGVKERGDQLAGEFDGRLDALAARAKGGGRARPTVAVIEWVEPPMVAGGWMPELVRIAGGEPVIVTQPGHFATVSWEDIAEADPDVVVILPCGFPVERTLRDLAKPELRRALAGLRAVREGRGFVADGNAYFNRPGPRIADSAEILGALIHPAGFTDLAVRHAGTFTTIG
jgi:iron complex transport system substrate-binding protein